MTFDMLIAVVEGLVKAVKWVVGTIKAVVNFFALDFDTAWGKVKQYIKDMITGIVDWFKSIPKKIMSIIDGGWQGILDGIKGIISSIVDGVKNFGSKIMSYFTSSDKDKKPAEAATPAVEATQQATTTAQATPKTAPPPDANKAAEVKAEQTKKAKAEQDAAAKTNSDLAKAKDPMEILRVEMQALNKQTTEMIRYMREQLDATKALNRNLYPH
jgi:hypothetical protein